MNTTFSTCPPEITQQTKPWWKYPYVWLIISGPLGVIVACLITAYFIMQHPETLVSEDYYQKGININKALGDEQSTLAPALAARNHAQTGTVPQKLLPK